MGTDDLPFRDLFELARKGDDCAQNALFRLALSMALRKARQAMEASDRRLLESRDIQQSILIRLYRRLPDLEFASEDALAAWLTETARRLVREKRRNLRRGCRDARRNVPLPDEGLADPGPAGVRDLIARLALEESLAKQSPSAASVVRLRLLGGLTFEQIAERLALPSADAARKRYSRAIRAIGGEIAADWAR